MTTAEKVMAGQGVFVTGELISSGESAPWTAPDGNVVPGAFKVKLLVNDSLVDIRFRDPAAMVDAIGAAIRGDVVTVPVFVGGKYDPETRSRGAVSFRYRDAA